MRRALLISGLMVGLLAGSAHAQTNLEVEGFFLPGAGGAKAFKVHASRTEMGLQLAHGNIVAQGGYKMPFTFSHGARSAAGASNSASAIAGTIGSAPPIQSGVFYHPAPTKGSIMAITLASSTALTAGTATAEAVVLEGAAGAGTTRLTGLTVVLDPATGYTRYRATTQARGLTTFTENDGLGCNTSTSAGYAPVTAELACTLIVEM